MLNSILILALAGAAETGGEMPNGPSLCIDSVVATGLSPSQAEGVEATLVQVLTEQGGRVSPGRCRHAPQVTGWLAVEIVRAGPLVLFNLRLTAAADGEEILLRKWNVPVEKLATADAFRPDLGAVVTVLRSRMGEQAGAAPHVVETSPAILPAATEPQVAQASQQGEVRSNPWPWVAAGVAGGGLVAGLLLGQAARSELKYARVDPLYAQGRRAAERYVLGANVSFGLAGVAALTSAVLFYFDLTSF